MTGASTSVAPPAPLHEAIEMMVSAAGRLLLADAEEPARCARQVRDGFTRLAHALLVYQQARDLSAELFKETGAPQLWVMDNPR